MEASDLEELVSNAVDSNLRAPNHEANILISELANTDQRLCDEIMKQLELRLQSNDSQTLLLTLKLIDIIVDNGSECIYRIVARRSFHTFLVSLTDESYGAVVQTEVLGLIQKWAIKFSKSTHSTFWDTYSLLRGQGVNFPRIDQNDDASVSEYSYNPGGLSNLATQDTSRRSTKKDSHRLQVTKLRNDLAQVMASINTARDLLETSVGEKQEDLYRRLIFLKQCQPRMNALIEGGLQGKINEDLLEECLNVNDQLIRTLDLAQASLVLAPTAALDTH